MRYLYRSQATKMCLCLYVCNIHLGTGKMEVWNSQSISFTVFYFLALFKNLRYLQICHLDEFSVPVYHILYLGSQFCPVPEILTWVKKSALHQKLRMASKILQGWCSINTWISQHLPCVTAGSAGSRFFTSCSRKRFIIRNFWIKFTEFCEQSPRDDLRSKVQLEKKQNL